jgi:hypothetical protein
LAKSSQDFYALAELQAKVNMLVANKVSLEQAISTLEGNSADKLNIEFALVNINLILQDYAVSNKLLNSIEQQHRKIVLQHYFVAIIIMLNNNFYPLKRITLKH